MPTSVVYHKFGGSFGTDSSPFKMFLYQRNRLYNIAKNFELRNLVYTFTLTSITYDAYKISRFLLYDNINHGTVNYPRIKSFIQKRDASHREEKSIKDACDIEAIASSLRKGVAWG